MFKHPFFIALATMLVGASTPAINEVVNEMPNPELVKFFAPVVAGMMGTLINRIFDLLEKRAERKRQKKGV